MLSVSWFYHIDGEFRGGDFFAVGDAGGRANFKGAFLIGNEGVRYGGALVAVDI